MTPAICLPMLMMLLSALAAPAAAQRLPHPCGALGQAYAIKWCVTHEAALMDSVYAAAARATVAAHPAVVRDSLAAAERAWLEQHSRAIDLETDPLQQLARDLIAKRRRVFRLRHQLLILAAASDPARMRVIPVSLAWRGTEPPRGLLLTLTNATETTMEFVARLYDPESDQLDERPMSIQPRASVRIGWIERWDWRRGMQIQLLHPQYAPLLLEAELPPGR